MEQRSWSLGVDACRSCLSSMARDRTQPSSPLELYQLREAHASWRGWNTRPCEDGALAFGGRCYPMERGTV
jgi:hypothetical protein